MKFAYIDESGSSSEGDVFVMAGLLIDAHRLRQQTYHFDNMLNNFLNQYPDAPAELKTKSFINGRRKWRLIPHDERKIFLKNVCQLATDIADIYSFALSFVAIKAACKQNSQLPTNKDYWSMSGMFICSLIQKHMQRLKSHKGLTVLIIDDNKMHMPKITEGIYNPNPWFDGLYQQRKKGRWMSFKTGNRFQHIINTAFAIKSEHSSFIQMADAICYVYRRWLELFTEQEKWKGEKDFYDQLVGILDKKRKCLGRTPSSGCVNFYNSIKHPNWAI